MSIATVLMPFIPQFCDELGAPISGGKVYSFEAGTSTPLALYTDSLLTVAYSNPIILNSDGRPAGPIYMLTTPAYKLRVDDANDVTIIGPADAIIAAAPAS